MYGRGGGASDRGPARRGRPDLRFQAVVAPIVLWETVPRAGEAAMEAAVGHVRLVRS